MGTPPAGNARASTRLPAVALGLLVASLFLLSVAPMAVAHTGGFGGPTEASYQMPTWVIWATGGVVVLLSFALVGAFLSEAPAREEKPSILPVTRAVDQPTGPLAQIGRGLGLAGLLVLAAIALVPGTGGQAPAWLLWVVTVSGLGVIAYAVGNPWPLVSPFRLLAPLADGLRGKRAPLALPGWLGPWPGTLALLGLIALEVWTGRLATGVGLARLAVAYTLVTLLAMTLSGSRTWLVTGEVLERLFAWWATLAPLSREPATGRWRWGWPGARLSEVQATGSGDVAFVVAMLYGVNFDAFLATGPGQAVETTLGGQGAGLGRLLTLVTGYLLFLGAFWACTWAVARIARWRVPLAHAGRRFAPSLIPIAVGYHLAHNALYLVQALPAGIALLADPLGLGWHLFTAPAWAELTLPTAWAPWLVATQMGLIVAGHVLAVIAAHAIAFASFPSRLQALKSELPITGLMVAYTVVGLYLVSLGHGGGGGL